MQLGARFNGLLQQVPLRSLAVVMILAVPLPASAQTALHTPVDQGPAWNEQTRQAYYNVDQGSRIAPLRWVEALSADDGSAFLSDGLNRFGYLQNPNGPTGLPVGFTGAKDHRGQAWLGMTCAACHTRELTHDDKTFRLDGGPALADFQEFLAELDRSVDRVLSDAGNLDDFSSAVLGADRSREEAKKLEADLRDWYHRYHTIMHGSLPKTHPWGPGRLDAMGMIVNRLAGLDLGPPPTHIIASNIAKADAPVRYPFLWNADKQACTQWLGFARNDNELFRMARNIGQVLGRVRRLPRRPRSFDDRTGLVGA